MNLKHINTSPTSAPPQNFSEARTANPFAQEAYTKASPFEKGGLRGIYFLRPQTHGVKSPLAPLLQRGGCGTDEREARTANPFAQEAYTKASPFEKGGLRGICHPGARQQGVALVVALVLLVVVTLVGLAAIRGTSLQEKMAGNMVDRAQAFQLTEGAIDLAARAVVLATPGPVASNYTGSIDCTSTSCADNPAIAIPTDSHWVTIPVSSSSNSATTNLVSLYGNGPSYLVQYMGSCSATGGGKFQFTNDQNNQGGGGSLAPASQCYRITARSGAAGADRSQIVLQAIYRVS